MSQLPVMDATAQAELVRSGEASPAELVDAAIERLEALNPSSTCSSRRCTTRRARRRRATCRTGRSAACRSSSRTSRATPPATRCTRAWASCASRAGSSRRTPSSPSASAPPGLVILGRTNCPELGILPTTEPHAFGAVAQPVGARPLHRRVERRVGGGGRRGHRAVRARQRRRRLDPHPGGELRAGRAQADAGADLAGAALRRRHGRAGERGLRDAVGARHRGAARRGPRPRGGRAVRRSRARAPVRSTRSAPTSGKLRIGIRTAPPGRQYETHPDCVAGGAGRGEAPRVARPHRRGGVDRRVRRPEHRRERSSSAGSPARRGAWTTGRAGPARRSPPTTSSR